MPQQPHARATARRSAGRLEKLVAAMVLTVVTACSDAGSSPMETVVELPIVAADAEGGSRFQLDMTQEVFPGHTGDPDGSGIARLRVTPGLGTVCWDLTVEDIDLPAIAAHIHRGPAGQAGPPVIWLTHPDETGTAAGCATGLDHDLLVSITRDPQSYYVNVHTADFAKGAVRSQLAH